MRNRQIPMNKGPEEALDGEVRFDDIKAVAAPYVSNHRMTVGRPSPLPCFAGKFGIDDLADGQTVHRARIEPETEFETSFVSNSGVIVTVVLEGKLEFALNANTYVFEAAKAPIALAWTNLEAVNVTRRTREGEYLVKCQVHTPLNYFDQDWRGGTSGFLERHIDVTSWRPGLSVTDAAQDLISQNPLSALRARMASSRFAVEALDSLLLHLESSWARLKPSRIASAKNHVEQTAIDKPSLDEIATAVGYSVSGLQRAYRAAYGMTVIEHQRSVLLEHALALLRMGEVSVAQAAEMTGYKTPTNFTSAFVKHFGVLPSKVRNGAE